MRNDAKAAVHRHEHCVCTIHVAVYGEKVDDWKQTWKQVASRLKRQVHIYTQSDTHTPEVWSTRPDGFSFLQQSTSPLAAYLQKTKEQSFLLDVPIMWLKVLNEFQMKEFNS